MEGVKLFYRHYYPIISQRFNEELNPAYEYHNLRHTLDVIHCALEIGRSEGCSEYELDLLSVSALFHDSGFLHQRKNHEDYSIKIFMDEAQNSALSPIEIDIICSCIKATQMPQNPQSKLEEILCDADLDYLGRSDFKIIGDLLYREMVFAGEIGGLDEWNSLQIKFLSSHKFFTAHSKEKRYPQLQNHLLALSHT